MSTRASLSASAHAGTSTPVTPASGNPDREWEGRGPVLTVSNLSVSFAGQQVTHRISLNLFPGRITALVGESGSGKSVTSMALPRLDPAGAQVEGSAVYRNIDLLSPTAPLRTIRGGLIGTVFQEPMTAFDPLSTIGHQVEEALTFHPQQGPDGKLVRLGRAERKARVLKQFEEVGLPDPERIWASRPHELSGGQLQRAMIAMAIINRPRVLIADEPTTALDVTTQKAILELLDQLAKRLDIAVLLITHDMGVVWETSQYVYVMQGGRIIEQGPTRSIFRHPREDYTRMLLDAVPRLRPQDLATEAGSRDAAPAPTAADGDNPGTTRTPLVSLRHVSYSYARHHTFRAASRMRRKGQQGGQRRQEEGAALKDVSFDIAPKETLALVGESGAGKSTLAKVISAQIRPTSGTVLLDGRNLSDLHGQKLREARSGIGFVFQDSGSALVPTHTIGWSIAEPLMVQGGTTSGERAKRVEEMLEMVGLDPMLKDRYPNQLSGGQRQRVGIARALILHPRLLIADEPTSSLDVTVQKRILRLFHDLQSRYEYACLFITHDLGIVQEVATHVVVLKSGKVMETGTVAQVLGHPRDPYTRTLLDASPRIEW